MDIYWHELSAYKGEIEDIAAKLGEFQRDPSCVANVTHFGIGLSNRALLILVGMCALVESRLYELAEEEQSKHAFAVDDINGRGITRLQKYLAKSKRINFGLVRKWDKFKAAYEIRNTFVHSYGGLVDTKLQPKAQEALEALGMQDALVVRRIRLTSTHMRDIHEIFTVVLEELRNV